jgi:hypothetical protein
MLHSWVAHQWKILILKLFNQVFAVRTLMQLLIVRTLNSVIYKFYRKCIDCWKFNIRKKFFLKTFLVISWIIVIEILNFDNTQKQTQWTTLHFIVKNSYNYRFLYERLKNYVRIFVAKKNVFDRKLQ